MIPMTSVEVLQDILRFAKDLTPLLTEKKLDTVISGLAEAREVVDKFKSIQSNLVAADEKLAKATAMQGTFDKQRIEIGQAQAEIAATQSDLAKQIKENAALRKELDKETKRLEDVLSKQASEAEANNRQLSIALAKAEADAIEIQAAKEAITAKLAKLAEVA